MPRSKRASSAFWRLPDGTTCQSWLKGRSGLIFLQAVTTSNPLWWGMCRPNMHWRRKKSSGQSSSPSASAMRKMRCASPMAPNMVLQRASGPQTSADRCALLTIQSGQIFVNNYGAGGGVELPFGGVKGSGHGREKGFEALYSLGTLKTVAIRHGV